MENVIIGVMAKSSTSSQKKQKNSEEKQLIEDLRRHPELFERMQAILALAESDEDTADEVEALLLEEVRRLGKSTMESWAGGAEKRASRDFKKENPDARYGKKNG